MLKAKETIVLGTSYHMYVLSEHTIQDSQVQPTSNWESSSTLPAVSTAIKTLPFLLRVLRMLAGPRK